MVPTVDLGLWATVFCSILIVGVSHRISFTFASSLIPPINIRAYVERDSRYLLCPSLQRVVNARDDLPDQLTPVRTVSVFLVNEMSTFRRLCVVTQKRSIVLDIGKWYGSIQRVCFFSNFSEIKFSHSQENTPPLLLLLPFSRAFKGCEQCILLW